jgi:hypothetical protein
MDSSIVIAAFLCGIAVGAWAAIRECANEVMHGGRKWWKVAIFQAEQRAALRRFKKNQDEVASLERSMRGK